jgi:hypothetical protein
MNAHKTLNLVLVFVFAFSFLGMPLRAAAQEPQPVTNIWISVWMPHQAMGHGWPLDIPVTLTIAHPGTPETPYYTDEMYPGIAPWDSNSTWLVFNLPDALVISVGDIVSMNNGTTFKTHIVEYAAITEVNPATDTVSGKADPNVEVEVVVQDVSELFQNAERYVLSNTSGDWVADFSVPGLGPEEQQVVEIMDNMYGFIDRKDNDNDNTTYGWSVLLYPPLNPIINVSPNQGFVYGQGWTAGAPVHLTVVRSGEIVYQADATVGPCGAGNPGAGPCGPNDVYFDMGPFTEGLRAGDLITLDGGGFTRSMTVSRVQATGIDINTGTLSGIAEPGQPVYMVVGSPSNIPAISDDDGNWTVVLGPQYTQWDMGGGAMQCDGNGNCTIQGWSVPKPYIAADANARSIQARERDWLPLALWTAGTQVTLTIDDPSTSKTPDYTDRAVMQPNYSTQGEEYAYWADFGWPPIGLKPGYVVRISGPQVTKTLTITLDVTDIDLQADTVAGVAEADAQVRVCANVGDNCIKRNVTAGEAGTWLADYRIPGSQPDDQQIVDIVPGMNFSVSEMDLDGDEYKYHWQAPNPFIVASPAEHYIEAREQDEPPLIAWPIGTLLTLKIDNPANGVGVDYTGTAIMGQDPQDPGNPNDLWADFAWPTMGLRTGFIVTVSANDISKTLVISPIQVNKIDVRADTVAGFSAPGAQIQVCVYGADGCIDRFVTANATGLWLANFHQTLDILLGMSGWAAVTDQDRDQVGVHWRVPVTGWKPANAGGFGDSRNSAITALEVFQGQLYAGTFNQNTGGQVWRLGTKGQWSKVMDAGFGFGPGNPAVIDLAIFAGQLYAGTGWNGIPGQVWRTADGRNWQAVTKDGFGQAGNTAVTNFVLFNNMLYAGTGHASGGSVQIWRSSSGRSGSWQQVAPDGPGSNGGNVTGFAVYKNVLYAAVESAIMATPEGYVGPPAQVWRSINGSDWMTVTADGFGDQNNISPGGFAQLNGYLYLGTLNQATGAQIWRTSDGLHWTKVMGNGFGDLNNIKIESLFVYNNQLYAATNNPSRGLQVWRSADGRNWLPVLVNGFGDSANLSTVWSSATVLYQGQAYIGTWNNSEGGQLWMSTP